MFPATPCPTLAGFTDWVYGVMGVPVAWLPTDSPSLGYAYNTAIATVNPAFRRVPGPFFLQAVYNLGGHLLATWGPDPSPWPGTPPAPFKTVDETQYGFFQYLRAQNNILGYTTGTVASAGDEGTAASIVVPKQAQNLTIGQLQLTTTPWGRWYLGLAQDFGTNWGIS